MNAFFLSKQTNKQKTRKLMLKRQALKARQSSIKVRASLLTQAGVSRRVGNSRRERRQLHSQARCKPVEGVNPFLQSAKSHSIKVAPHAFDKINVTSIYFVSGRFLQRDFLSILSSRDNVSDVWQSPNGVGHTLEES